MVAKEKEILNLRIIWNRITRIYLVKMWRISWYLKFTTFFLSLIMIVIGIQYVMSTYYTPAFKISEASSRNLVKVEDTMPVSTIRIPTNPNDGSPNIEKILEITKAKINFELLKNNFTYPSVTRIDDLLMDAGGKPIRNLIISTWRSGTTFLGEVVSSAPGTFYYYEPLYYYGVQKIRGPPLAGGALKAIRSLYACNFTGMEDYFNFGRLHDDLFHHNKELWNYCKHKKDLCLDPDFQSRFCRLFPIQTMKLVRVRLRLIRELLEDKELNVKVVLMVRDPRAVMQSRLHCNFCQRSADCREPEPLCSDMVSDYFAASRLLPLYPNRLMVIRYEELALSPNITATALLKFLKLNTISSLDWYLRSHTNMESTGIYNTFRKSQDVPFKWKTLLDYNYVDKIQSACKDAMQLWGYHLAHNATHMTNNLFNPLANYSIKPFT